jgi:drug/metabolite transporter (DMT)-like permease
MNRLAWSGLLLAIVAVWGWTFVLVKDAVGLYGVLPFLAVRFAIGTACLAGFAAPHVTRKTFAAGAGIGIVLALAFLLQTIGLNYSTATNTGVITGLFVVFAPLANRLLFGVKTSGVQWAAIVASLIGLLLLTGSAPGGLVVGDLLTLGGAASFGLHVALLDRYSKHHSAQGLVLGQLAAATLIFLCVWPLVEAPCWPSRQVWPALLICGAVATALAFFVQTSVQARLSAVRTVMIMLMEPIFAAVFGYLLHGDRLNGAQVAGAALMVVAIFIAELYPYLRPRAEAQQHISRRR